MPMTPIELRLLEEAQFNRTFIYVFAACVFLVLLKLTVCLIWLSRVNATVRLIHKKVIRGVNNQEGFKENIQDMLTGRSRYDRWMESVNPQISEIATLLKVQDRNSNKNRNNISINESEKVKKFETAFIDLMAEQLRQKEKEIDELKKRLQD